MVRLITIILLCSSCCVINAQTFVFGSSLNRASVSGGNALSIVEIGFTNITGSTSWTSTVANVYGTIPSGSGIVVIQARPLANVAYTWGVYDSAGNSSSSIDDTNQTDAGNGQSMRYQSYAVTTPIPLNGTIVITNGTGNGGFVSVIAVLNKWKSSGWFDVGAANNIVNFAQNVWSGTTPAQTGSSDTAIASWISQNNPSSLSVGQGFTMLSTNIPSASYILWYAYKTGIASGASLATNSLSAASSANGIIGVYKNQ